MLRNHSLDVESVVSEESFAETKGRYKRGTTMLGNTL